ncbi:MAG: FHA domain-containing protein [Candidatus Competibacteraceae bacterium]|nr:FHA domain-containing protein [Candidatus Competibacteraceae bacterium]
MKLPNWPLFRRRSEPKIVFGPARLIRTDLLSAGALRLRSPLCRIGRALDNDICFDNDTVSGHHAEIYHLPDGTFQICDLHSTNGTWVNGQSVRTRILKNSDVVELGGVRLHFRTDKG